MTPELADRTRTTWLAVAALALIAFALRWSGAGDPLWLDELVSVDFVTGENGPKGVLTVHDNNHFLNTLWLALVGIDAPARLQRALSIALGVAAVPLAALLMMPRGRLAGLAAAAMVALATPLVVYGSEARGYAGLVVCALTLMIAADRHLDGGPARLRWIAAGATAFGLAFQPLMAITCVGVGVAVFLTEWRRTRAFRTALARSVAFLSPSIAVGALLVAIVGQAARDTGIAFGGVVLFSVSNFLTGYSRLVGSCLGLPDAVHGIAPLVALAALALAMARPASASDGPLIAGALLIGPLAFLLITPPNAEMARYHIGAGLGGILALVLAGRTLWLLGVAGKATAVLIAAAWFGGTVVADAEFLATGRGSPQVLLADASRGLPDPVTVQSNRPLLAVYYLRAVTRATGTRFQPVDTDAPCETAPDLVFDWTGDRPALLELDDRDTLCGASYDLIGKTKAFWLSGMDFAVWRRRP